MDPLHENEEYWYAVHCQPSKEYLVQESIVTQLGLSVYLPEIAHRVRGKLRHAPLFPCYLFVRVNLRHEGLRRLHATQGVIQLLGYGDTPQPVETPVIEALRARVDHMNAHRGPPAPSLQPGAVVRLTQGPLQGLEAVFVGPIGPSERVRVLLEFLGRPRTVEVPLEGLEVNLTAPRRLARRSRGAGRPIR